MISSTGLLLDPVSGVSYSGPSLSLVSFLLGVSAETLVLVLLASVTWLNLIFN